MFEIVVVVLLTLSAIVILTLIWQARQRQELLKKDVFERLLAAISNHSLTNSDLPRLRREANMSALEAKEVAIRTYRACYLTAFDDAKLRQELSDIASKLRLTARDSDAAMAPVQMEKYGKTWEKFARNGLPSPAGLEAILAHQKQLGIAAELAAQTFGPRAAPLYRAAFKLWLENSSAVSSEYLRELRTALGLDEATALGLVKRDCVDYAATQCDALIQSGTATISDRNQLVQLFDRLGVDSSELVKQWQMIDRLVQVQCLREGTLPRVEVKIALRPAEICHYRDICSFSWISPRGEARSITGELFVSNQRFIFASREPGKSFEVKLSSIVDVDGTAKGVQIRCTANKGTGIYAVGDAEVLEATFVGVLRNDHSPAIRNRSIPSFVKQQVWARDKGRCLSCGAAEDLHYDHDIPFSKGGANTVENIRLLCARCNLAKRDRIE